MATDTTLRGGFVTWKLLALAAVIFLLNTPTLTAWGTPTAQAGAAILYLGVALIMASLGKALLVVVRHGPRALTA